MQSCDDKRAAIVSLLGWVYTHLAWVPGAERTQRQEWVSERSPLDDPPAPPRPVNLSCHGHCFTCLAHYQSLGTRPDCPAEDKWIREFRRIRRQTRLMDVERALLELADWNINTAQAVWAVFVEPWPGELVDVLRPALGTKTEAIGVWIREERARLAEEGVEWMAEVIEGEVSPVELVEQREIQARQMASWGYTRKRIAKELRCSLRDVQRWLSPHVSAQRG